MASTAEADLIRRSQAGDRDAFDELVGPLIHHAFRLAFGMLHDRSAAEDAVQDAALLAWRKLKNLRAATPMRPWFLGIVANQCRTTARASWWSVLRFELIERPSPGALEDEVVRGAAVKAALRALPIDQREAIVLRYYLDLPLEEIAAVAGIPLGTVKSRISRGVAAMRPLFIPLEALI